MQRVTTKPFRFGQGAYPPHFAGRGHERAYFTDQVTDLLAGVEVAQDVLVYAPRGHGKTVLTGEKGWGEQARRRGVGYLRVSSRTMRADLLDLVEPVAPWQAQERTLRGRLGALLGGGQRWARSEALASGPGHAGMRRLLAALLEDKTYRCGLVLVVDEAHEVAPAELGALLNASQDLRTAGRPLLVVLAGTPGLKATLMRAGENEASRAGATFWDKSRRFPLGLLGEAETREAFEEPLLERGITVEPEVLAHVVEESQGYPAFIQMLGEALWEALPAGRKVITEHVLQAAWPAFRERRQVLYQEREEELVRAGLDAVARRLGCRLRSPEVPAKLDTRIMLDWTEQEMEAALGTDARAWRRVCKGPALAGQEVTRAEMRRLIEGLQAGEAKVTGALVTEACVPVLDYLQAKGFVWKPEANNYCLGIPSLAGYLDAGREPA